MYNKNYPQLLAKAADQFGVITVLALFGEGLRVRIPMSDAFWDASIDELNLQVRARNGLMRADADLVGKVAERIMSAEGIERVRNLGKKSVTEIKTALLAEGYERLSPAERVTFWRDVIAENDIPERRG